MNERVEERLSFKTAVMQRLLDRQMARVLAPYGLSLTAYRTLATVDAFPDEPASELARICALDKAIVSRSVADATDAGFVSQRVDPENRRRKLLRLTPLGRQQLDAVDAAVSGRQAGLDALFTADERALFLAFVDRVSTHAATIEQPQKTLAA
ncbi:MAG: MarR family transcriptional regulator [Pseudomonadota bacterium]